MNKKKNIVPFEDFSIDIPIVKFKINDKEYLALLDTGCEDSLFDDTFEKHVRISENTNVNLIGFAGETGADKIAVFNVKFGNIRKEYSVNAFMADMSTISSNVSGRIGKDVDISAFFGSSFFNKYNCEIDYEQKALILK